MCKLQGFQKGSFVFSKTGIMWRSSLCIKLAKKQTAPNLTKNKPLLNRFKRGCFLSYFLE